ncbi:uncharacterized protein LOC127257878 [Andrographis paniculata]|uniref:uncharacterized protein LOC127257878 n=1 Tax=Andrographis paniculata TaxID=175694 RepID=UPI0021E9758D|nr:uncharacterized protein LOC127257878 [Andrographis paniculata]
MDLVFDLDDHNKKNNYNKYYFSSSSSCSLKKSNGFGSAIAKLFRVLEASFIFFFLVWASTRLPFAVRISGEYFRRLLNLLLSHFSIFLLSNFIVLTLLFKSRKQAAAAGDAISDDLCYEILKNHWITSGGGRSPSSSPPPPPENIVYEDKQAILELPKGVVRRSRSENLRRSGGDGDNNKVLRRSETAADKWRRRAMVDELSNEEFRRAIEAFIARQIKFHREEKLAIVVHR